MKKIYKDRINALADLIEKQPVAGEFGSEGFNMDRWVHSCGMPSCIAGWACHMEGNIPFTAYGVSKQAEKYLGLTSKMDNLFLPFEVFRESITPSDAATTLRKLAETGKVDWSHVKGEL